jgi:hypothetical protein
VTRRILAADTAFREKRIIFTTPRLQRFPLWQQASRSKATPVRPDNIKQRERVFNSVPHHGLFEARLTGAAVSFEASRWSDCSGYDYFVST